MKFSFGIIFSIFLFGAGKSILFNKKTIPRVITKTKANLITKLIIFVLELVFDKLHIVLVNFKLRHICVFSIKKLMKSKENIVFLGMMGSGKSSIGSLVAKKAKIKVYRLDREIEKELDMNIKEIFETKGEKFFSNLEEDFPKQI